MIVAVRLRRNRKITSTTRITVSISVNCTSRTDSRIEAERSRITRTLTDAGTCASMEGSTARTRSTTSMVLASGWRWMASTMARVPLNQFATCSLATLSFTWPRSRRRTGLPLR